MNENNFLFFLTGFLGLPSSKPPYRNSAPLALYCPPHMENAVTNAYRSNWDYLLIFSSSSHELCLCIQLAGPS